MAEEDFKASLGFSKFSPGELRDFARGTYMGMKGNLVYPKPPVSMEELLAKIEALSESIVAAMDGGRTAFSRRNKHVEELRRMLVQNGHYVQATAPDRVSFLSSGYKLAPQARTQTLPLNKAIRNLDWGENSGSFRFRFMAVDGADSYELRYAPQLEDGTPGEWKTQPFGKTKGYITVTGFTPGMTYIFQVRALIHTQFTDWSDPVTKMCT
jgi:Fibronectin type III domain